MIHDGRRIHLRAGLIAAPIRLRYKGSSGSNTVEQQSGPPQQVLNNYQNAYNTAQNVADNPSSGQSYSGATVAGFTPMQDAGFNAINTAANAGQPFLNAASQDVTNSQTPLLTPGLENQINANSGSTVANAANAWDSGIASSATGYAGGIQNAAGTGASGITNAANTLSPASLQQWESPYTQQVVGATEAQFNNQNAIQQTQLAGNAASAGAFGGDRQAVAQSVLAGQQQAQEAPVIAGLENQGYQTALGAAQQQAGLQTQAATAAGQLGLSGAEGAGQLGLSGAENAGQMAVSGASTAAQLGMQGVTQELGANEANAWLNSQGSFSLGNLGNEAQQQGLTAANSFLTAGGTQQQQAQNELNVPYESYLAAQAYPYQTSSFLTNAAEGLGSLSGGTGSTTSPGPSTLSQVAGLGVAGIGGYGLLNNSGLLSGVGDGLTSTGTSAADQAVGAADDAFIGGNRGGRVAGFAPGGAVGVSTVPNTGGIGGPVGIGVNMPDVSVNMIGGGRPLVDSSTGTTSTTTGGSSLSPLGSLINAGAGLAAGIFGGPAAGFAANELGSVDPRASPGYLLAGARGGAVPGYDVGGNVVAAGGISGIPDYSQNHFPASTAAPHGSNIPRPPPAAPTAGMGGLGDVSQAMQLAKGMEGLGTSLAESRGGAVDYANSPLNLGGLGEMMRGHGGVSPLRHLDTGGSAGEASTPAGLSASVGGNPGLVQLQQSYSGLPTETLQEIAARTPPGSAQSSLVQRALQMRKMNPGSDPSLAPGPSATPQGQSSGMSPTSPTQQGGFGGLAPGFAPGGDVGDGDDWDDSVASLPTPAAAAPTAGVGPLPDITVRAHQPAPTAGVGSLTPDPALARAAHMLESSGSMQPGLTGDSGAAHGPMQVHPAALADVNAKLGTSYTPQQLEAQPEIGKLVGDTYLAMQQQRFGSPALALGAYNAGPGAMQAAIDNGKGLAGLPASTQQYVTKGIQLAGFGPTDATLPDAGGSDTAEPTPGMAPMPAKGQGQVTGLETQALKPNPWEALLAAGLGIMSGTSKFPGVNIGRGATEGLQDYTQQRQQNQQDALRRAQLSQTAAQTAQTGAYQQGELSLRQQQMTQTGQQQAALLAETKREHDINAIPPDVRETQWYEQQPPEIQAQYRQLKMAQKGLTDIFGNPTAGAAIAPGTSQDLHGADYLATLNPQAATTVKALAEGRMAMPTRPTPQQQQLIQAAAQYDPTFDATDFNKRNRTAVDFSPAGQSGKAVTAINTTMGHLSELQDRMDTLGNTNIPIVNTVKNWIGTQTGDAAPGQAQTVRDAVANELRKVFATTGGGGLEELKEWEANFPTNASPAQAKEGIKEAVRLMDSRLSALGNQYSVGMGTNHSGIDLLSPEARASYQKLIGGQPAAGNVQPPTFNDQRAAPVPNAPARPATASPPPVAPPLPRGVPGGSLYSPSRGMWRDPSGNLYSANGAPASP